MIYDSKKLRLKLPEDKTEYNGYIIGDNECISGLLEQHR